MNYYSPPWAIKQITRADGRIEDICRHGCGHPNVEWLQTIDPHGNREYRIHGCCGCCVDGDKER